MKKKCLIMPFFTFKKIVAILLCLIFTNITFGKKQANLISNLKAAQQQLIITGTVTDASTGEALPGTNILVEGTTKGTVSDINGKYSITITEENAVLIFSSIGYLTEKIVVQGQSQIDVKLSPDIINLKEIVVVGYGKQSRVKVTGAVSTVNEDDLEGRPVRVASQALQGKVPGLVIASASGQPGREEISLTIRGKNSWGTNSTPLVLIDGVPGDMDALSPDIIENITVLKDATSAAIYGSRAANGVILVTTKRGKTGKVQITYSSTLSTQSPTLKYESIQDPVEFMKLYNTSQINTRGGTDVLYSPEDIAMFENGTYTGTNWNDYIYQKKLVQEHRLNLSGGNETVKYNTGVSYLDQPGIIKSFGYDRYNYFGNFDLDVNKYISGGGGMSYTRGNASEPSWGVQNIMILSLVAKPTYNPTYIDPETGETKIMRSRWKKESRNRSLYDQLFFNGKRNDMSDILNLQAYINVTPLEGLVWHTKAATYYTHNYDKTFQIQESDTWYQADNSLATSYTPKSIKLSVSQPWTQLNTIYSTLSYTKSIASHHFDLMGGYELNNRKDQTMTASRQNYPSNETQELNVGGGSQLNGGRLEEWAILSYFGRFNYDFASKYLLEAVIRNDKSSRFPKGYKSAVFPSISLGWRISEEEFMTKLPFISDLKLRGSWGKLGNQDISTYSYQATYTINDATSYNFGGVEPGVIVGNLVNDLSWETTTVKNLGFDLNIKNGLFMLTTEFYNKLTTDILRGIQVMGHVGRGAPTINDGEMENKGVELMIGHKNQISDKFSYWINANMSFNKNTVVDFGSEEKSSQTIIKEGEEYNAWYLLEMVGIYQENDPDLQTLTVDGITQTPGQIKYKDVNSDGDITAEDRQIVGNRYPKMTFGVNFGAEYKNFDFSAFISGVQGYDGYQSYFGFQPFVQGGSPHVLWRNAWTPENKSNTWPKLYNEGEPGGTWYSNHPSTFFLTDLSYIRLKNIQLGYNFPSSLLKSTPINSLRVYISGENILSFYNDKYNNIMTDPETQQDNSYLNYRYPQLRTMSFGLTLKF